MYRLTQQLIREYHRHHELCDILKDNKTIPKYLRKEIIDNSFHPTIQILSAEYWSIKYLTDNNQLDIEIAHHVLSYLFGNKNGENNVDLCLFHIGYDGKTDGLLSGRLTTPCHTCCLNITHGNTDTSMVDTKKILMFEMKTRQFK